MAPAWTCADEAKHLQQGVLPHFGQRCEQEHLCPAAIPKALLESCEFKGLYTHAFHNLPACCVLTLGNRKLPLTWWQFLWARTSTELGCVGQATWRALADLGVYLASAKTWKICLLSHPAHWLFPCALERTRQAFLAAGHQQDLTWGCAVEQAQLRYPERSQPSAPCTSLLNPDCLSGFGMTLALSGGATWTRDSCSCPVGSQQCLVAVLYAHQDAGQERSWKLRQLILSFCRCYRSRPTVFPRDTAMLRVHPRAA